MKKHRNQTVSTQFSSQREKPDQKILKKHTGKQKIYKILFDYQQKQLASNKVCHTLSSSQRTHTHQHHQPQQPANFSEPCSNFLEFVTLSGATRPAYQTLFPAANPVTQAAPAEPARPTLNPGAQTSAHRNRIRVVIANPKPAPVSL